MTSGSGAAGPTEFDTESDAVPHVLREYALLADGERGIVLGPRGGFVWMCAPRWDCGAIFARLLGGPGTYAITPEQRFVWGGYYEDGSLIWHSRWVTDAGIVECREALAFPGDPRCAVVLRQVRALSGSARVRVRLEPVGEFGRVGPTEVHRDDADLWHARIGGLRLRWTGAPEATVVDDGNAVHWETTLEIPEGGSHDLVLECADRPLDPAAPDPARLWAGTETAWRRALPRLGPTVAPRDTRHSYAVLRGLTSAGGGTVAAATMSLPERARAGRNYDYRYVWIRDQCYVGQAVAADGPHPLLDGAVRFVTERLLADGPRLQPAYTTSGTAVPVQRSVGLPGYPGGSDTAGNLVRQQFQLDALGEALLLFAAAARHDRLGRDQQRAVDVAIAAIQQRWREPDAGIWELDPARWAHSRLTCAAGLRAIAAAGSATADSVAAEQLADRLVADAAADCVHRTGRWQRAPDDPRVDAALLLPALRGALPASDPRSIATFRAVCAELSRDGYVFRFQPDARPLGAAEGAFVMCGFLAALAADQRDEPLRAFRFFERNRAACGPPGLFSEEYDVTQRQLRGNLPQAFAHALQFEAAVRLARCADQADIGDDDLGSTRADS